MKSMYIAIKSTHNHALEFDATTTRASTWRYTNKGERVKTLILSVLLCLSFPLTATEQNHAKAANENPFLDGKFNPAFIGQLTGIAGEVIEIVDLSNNRRIYKLNLRIEGVEHIWATSIAEIPGGPLLKGDMVIFKGYISSSKELDPDVGEKINDKTFMLALRAERP